ncbi:MAG: NAD(P)/FAD-dependent oxidoreductase [Chloroflexi bacterium]|nr:NAD(P)/FAD-dependent oxidoreductase [Chloroflexota bacterium]
MGGSRQTWDAIVVGARVAGSTLAMYLGRAGLRTLLIDRAQFPAYVPRQGSWEHPTERRWQELGVWPAIRAVGAPARRGYYSAVGDAVLRYRFPEGDPAAYNMMVRRIVLDDILARHAASLPGVELRMSQSASALLWDGDRVVGVGVTEAGRAYEERARVVVGADGRHSWMARQVQAQEYERVVSPKANFIADYANTNVQPDMSVRLWDGIGSMGMVMMEDNLVTIGMGVPLTDLPAFRAGLPESFEQRLRRHPLYREHLGPALRVSPIGGAVDLAMFKRKPYGPGWALVGDAGYHLDPLAARGTTAAVVSAELLARAIVASRAGAQPEAAAFAEYQTARDAALAPEWDVTHSAIMRPPPTERDLQEARLLAARPDLVALHIAVLRGLRDAAEFRQALDDLLPVLHGSTAPG